MNNKWYVLQVLSGQEKKIKKALEDARCGSTAIHAVLLPTEQVSEFRNGEQKLVEKKLWAGYLFVHLDLSDETWSAISDIHGVIGFLGGSTPSALSDEEVEKIIADLREKEEKGIVRSVLAVGDRVKIVDGVFVNFTGLLTDLNVEKGRVSVLVSIFGRDTRVDDLTFSQVEKVTLEEKNG